MRRAPTALAALAVAMAPAPAAALAQAPANPPRLAARVTECSVGPAAQDRTAVFTGSMPPVAGAATMAMRFDLFERGATGRWKRMSVPNFGTWERSDPGVGGFVFAKHVEALGAPAAYRVRVRFRWYSPAGRVIRRSVRTSRACVQPDLRPDLRVSAIGVTVGPSPDLARYVVTVRNEGRGAVGAPFGVALWVGGAAQPAEAVPSLDAGESTKVSFVAPWCTPGTAIRAAADPDRAVDEADEADNTAVQTCPAGAS